MCAAQTPRACRNRCRVGGSLTNSANRVRSARSTLRAVRRQSAQSGISPSGISNSAAISSCKVASIAGGSGREAIRFIGKPPGSYLDTNSSMRCSLADRPSNPNHSTYQFEEEEGPERRADINRPLLGFAPLLDEKGRLPFHSGEFRILVCRLIGQRSNDPGDLALRLHRIPQQEEQLPPL